MTAVLIPLAPEESAGLLEEWGEPRHVNPDPKPEPATVPTMDLRVPEEVRDA
jgi:hypothetical protein